MKKLIIIILFFVGLAVSFSQPKKKYDDKIEMQFIVDAKVYTKGTFYPVKYEYTLLKDHTWSKKLIK